MKKRDNHAIESEQPSRGDPFAYGRKKSTEKEREAEWVESLRNKNIPIREQFNTILSETAPRQRPVKIHRTKSDSEIRLDVLKWNKEHRSKRRKMK